MIKGSLFVWGIRVRKTPYMAKEDHLTISYESFIQLYQLGKILGSGSQGLIYQIRSRKSNQEYAFKLVKKRQGIEAEILTYLYQKRYLSHFQIVHIQAKEAYILPLIKGISLSQASLKVREKKLCLWQILYAIYCLHNLSKPILMNDLYGENIILDKHIHLIDFGDSRWLSHPQERWIDYHQWSKLCEDILPKGSLLLRFFKSMIQKEKKSFFWILHFFYYRYVYLFVILALVFFYWIYQEV